MFLDNIVGFSVSRRETDIFTYSLSMVSNLWFLLNFLAVCSHSCMEVGRVVQMNPDYITSMCVPAKW